MKKLEDQVIQLHSKIDTRYHFAHDKMEKFAAELAQITTQMSSWKDEMMEIIRLNKPIPPVMNSTLGLSSINGKAHN